jgi:hypothetical protein
MSNADVATKLGAIPTELANTELKLAQLIDEKRWAEMSDDFHYTNGSHAAWMVEINALRERVKQLRAGQ